VPMDAHNKSCDVLLKNRKIPIYINIGVFLYVYIFIYMYIYIWGGKKRKKANRNIMRCMAPFSPRFMGRQCHSWIGSVKLGGHDVTSSCVCVYMCVRVCVCVCVREREQG